MPLPGRLQNAVGITVLWNPAQHLPGLAVGGDQHSRVTGPAGRQFHREVHTGDSLGRLDDFPDRQPLLAAQVEDLALASPEQVLQGQPMRRSQVAGVDVIPDAGAVRGGVIGTEDGNALPLALRCLKHQWNQVGFGGVILPDKAARRSTGGIEVAQRHIFQAIRSLAPVASLVSP